MWIALFGALDNGRGPDSSLFQTEYSRFGKLKGSRKVTQSPISTPVLTSSLGEYVLTLSH